MVDNLFRIRLRVGAITQDQAEERLDIEIASSAMRPRAKDACAPTFTDSTARYLAQSHSKRSIDVSKCHVTLVQWLDTHMKKTVSIDVAVTARDERINRKKNCTDEWDLV